MGPCEDIVAARRTGHVRCGVVAAPGVSLSDLAGAFGLLPEVDSYRGIDRTTAHRVLSRLLGCDMAYGLEVMPVALAEELGGRFLAQFGSGARYFTNGDWQLPGGGPLGWEAVTEATFDGGVLVLDAECSGCLWIEDED